MAAMRWSWCAGALCLALGVGSAGAEPVAESKPDGPSAGPADAASADTAPAVDETDAVADTAPAPPPSESQRVRKALARGMRVDFNPEGTSYGRIMATTQLWGRVLRANPGSLDADTREPLDYYADFALRRVRLMLNVSIENRFLFFAQIGVTSLPSYADALVPVDVHDFQGQIRIAGEHYLGGGMHFFQGLSRLRGVGHADHLMLDAPEFGFPNVNVDDAIVRQIGVFARGNQGPFGYQLSVNVPMMPTSSTRLLTDEQIATNAVDGVAFARRHSDFNLRGYFYYSLLDPEKQTASGRFRMTGFGQEGRVLNVGAGFQLQPSGTGYWDAATGSVVVTKILALAADVYLDHPLRHESGVTAYLNYDHWDAGPDFTQTSSVMGGFAVADPAGGQLLPAASNTQYSFGSGHLVHAELGYVLPRTLIDSDQKLQPFGAFTVKALDALDQVSLQYHLGLNWAIVGQNVKVTAEYASRPLFDPGTRQVATERGTFIVQLQLRI